MKVASKHHASIDGLGILLGRPAFTDDLIEMNTLTIVVKRSPHAYARIQKIDTTLAEQMPGVEGILTKADFSRIAYTRAGQGYPEPSPHDKFVFDDFVRYIGDEVCAVAAISREIAQAAVDAIVVDYEVLPPVLDFQQAKDHPSIIHPEPDIYEMFPIGFEPKRNIAASYHMHIGNVEDTLAKSEVVVEQTFFTQAQAHAMMEPHACNARLDYLNRLVVYSTTQTPFHVRRIIAQVLEMPLSRIRVIKPRVGGGFGGKQAIHGDIICAKMTLKTGKPTRLVYTRKEVFEATYSRHPMRITMRLGANQAGVLEAIDCHILSDTGAYGEHALTVFMVAGSKVLPLYNKVKSVRFHGDVVYTNKTPAGAFRGYGAIQGNFALESTIDLIAKKCGLSPIAFRKRNMMLENETSPIFAIMGEGTEGTAMIMETCKLPECIERGIALMGWDKPKANPPYPYKRGRGMAIAMQGSGIPYIDMGSATIKLNDDGFFNLLVGATEIGQGSDTVLAQIAAEGLETTLENIIVYSSDSDLTPFDTGAYASSTTYVSGNAVYQAAQTMKKQLIHEAAMVLQCEDDHIRYDGFLFVNQTNHSQISLKELSNRLYYNHGQKQLMVTESYVGHKSPPPFMAGFCEVLIDTMTGQIHVERYTSVVDCGTVINPMLARGQVEGAIIQGMGMTLYEESHRNALGKLIENDFLHYRIPTRKELPVLLTEFIESYEPSGPYGAKSVGEIGIDTPPAAIANAIEDAIGVRFTELPITAEKIYFALQSKEKNV